VAGRPAQKSREGDSATRQATGAKAKLEPNNKDTKSGLHYYGDAQSPFPRVSTGCHFMLCSRVVSLNKLVATSPPPLLLAVEFKVKTQSGNTRLQRTEPNDWPTACKSLERSAYECAWVLGDSITGAAVMMESRNTQAHSKANHPKPHKSLKPLFRLR